MEKFFAESYEYDVMGNRISVTDYYGNKTATITIRKDSYAP